MIFDLNVKVRKELKKESDSLRTSGQVPGVIYGPEVDENINVTVEMNVLEKVYSEGGESSLINLQVEGEKEVREVLIKDMVFDPVIDRAYHVDFYQIKRGEKLDIEPTLEFVGISAAVKALGGILVKNLDSVEIRCLPRDMISTIEVDLTKLETFEDRILVSDLPLPEGVELLTDPKESVAMVQEPAEEEVDAPVGPAVAAVEGEEGEKPAEGGDAKQEEAPAEGKKEEKK
jgi:large subunit ribosomal protein L25